MKQAHKANYTIYNNMLSRIKHDKNIDFIEFIDKIIGSRSSF